MKEAFKNLKDSIANSYSQVLFSNNHWMALLLFTATFINPAIGLSGFISVVFGLLLLRLSGFNPATVKSGLYTYNLLFTGLGMGATYPFNFTFVIVLLIAALITLLITIWMASLASRYKLPFLSLPFVFGFWIVLLNAQNFDILLLKNVNDSSYLNIQGFFTYSGLDSLRDFLLSRFPKIVILYFKSLAYIFFQTDILAGLLISAGLLIFSRIAFTLSWLGFICGYIFFRFEYPNMTDADYIIPGFNYIFSAIALGGFFLIPSTGSYLLVILSTPVTGFLMAAAGRIIEPYNLPLYSLPFSLSTILFLTALLNRYTFKYFHLVQYQLYSPEKNLYTFHNHMERFKNDRFTHIHLPFYGEWFISQGHEGSKTHKEDWRFAWDFVVTDDQNKTYSFPGDKTSDFYCYSLPVIAPCEGIVVKIQDGIDDNKIGDVNLAANWGNTIIVKHNEYLFSKISHLKKESFIVKEGDHVKKGDMLALCGNSGRSPEPHIHFQLQATAFIGAKTLKYPISYYLSKKDDVYDLHSFEFPDEGETVLRPVPSHLIQQAFYFTPGMKLDFNVIKDSGNTVESWEVFTDISNNSYLYCSKTKSTAYFTNNETLFYFTSFSGDKTSLLYYFYLGAYKVLLSYYPGMEIRDQLSIETYYNGVSKLFQDLIAPFYIFMKPAYKATFADADNEHTPNKLKLISSAFSQGNAKYEIKFEFELSGNKIQKIIVNQNGLCTTAEIIAS
ncbi:MAG: urea transporter [Bacteroidota bacterium]|nr:urea transporter [Bacteroidota bacterium]